MPFPLKSPGKPAGLAASPTPYFYVHSDKTVVIKRLLKARLKFHEAQSFLACLSPEVTLAACSPELPCP